MRSMSSYEGRMGLPARLRLFSALRRHMVEVGIVRAGSGEMRRWCRYREKSRRGTHKGASSKWRRREERLHREECKTGKSRMVTSMKEKNESGGREERRHLPSHSKKTGSQ
jgi:hypothetical protein